MKNVGTILKPRNLRMAQRSGGGEVKNPSDKLEEIRGLVENALLTDGDHHKQWFLWQIAEVVGVDIDPDNVEEGVAP